MEPLSFSLIFRGKMARQLRAGRWEHRPPTMPAPPCRAIPGRKEPHANWLRKGAGRRLPGRRDLDPADIPRLLPHVMLVEVPAGGRYRYRLIGTENVREHGIDATGRYLDEVLPGPDYKAHVLRLYDEC